MIMVRHCEDDYAAWELANIMEAADAVVICITDSGGTPGAKEPNRYCVWARVADGDHIRRVDDALEKRADELAARALRPAQFK